MTKFKRYFNYKLVYKKKNNFKINYILYDIIYSLMNTNLEL